MTLNLALKTVPDVPLEADMIRPDRLAGLTLSEIAALPLLHGNRPARLDDFFDISGTPGEEIHVAGDLSRVKLIGAAMTGGSIVIDGDVGSHLGVNMSGGKIVVEGNAGDWVGPEMLGGRILIKGDAGHMVGSAYRGSRIGMQGGEIIVQGRARNEIGNTMRGGLIVIGGDGGDFTGVNMLAGTIVVLGRLGQRPGAGMKRGTIVTMHDAEMLPTFAYACTYRPTFLRQYLLYLQQQGLAIEDAQIEGAYRRWSGDCVEMNRGEVLLFDG